MPGFPIPTPRFRAFDSNGDPLAGGKLYSYAAGTTTPANTYSDRALTTPNANPVILDADGEATIYIPDENTQVYKFELRDSADVVQWTVDNIAVPAVEAPPAAQAVPTGALLPFGGAAAPSGYLMCDGSVVSRTTYADLFVAIGTTFGAGDGSTTFGIPDLRQKFPLGKAASGTGNVLGGTGGAIDHTHSGGNHTHDSVIPRDWSGGTQASGTAVPDGRLLACDGAVLNLTSVDADKTVTSGNPTASTTGTANPPFIALNFIIKT
jgi:microcystin-dependent protein